MLAMSAAAEVNVRRNYAPNPETQKPCRRDEVPPSAGPSQRPDKPEFPFRSFAGRHGRTSLLVGCSPLPLIVSAPFQGRKRPASWTLHRVDYLQAETKT